jgi:pimeloyl-ACP methyl ester carboxylesterase
LSRATRGGIDVDGVAGADFDGTLLYFGHSMGAIIGSITAGVLPGLSASVVNAAGGGMGGIFQSPGLTAMLQLLVRPALGMTYEDPSYPNVLPFYAGFLQTMFAPADPISYAALARARHDDEGFAYLLQEDVGDRLVPNSASEDLGAAMGLTAYDAERDFDHAALALWRLAPDALGFPAQDDPHGLYFATDGARTQAATFLTTRGRVLLDPRQP